MAGNSGAGTRFGFIRLGVDDLVNLGAGYGYTVGGVVEEFSAAATLKVGDIVYLSAANTVNKSNVLATNLGKRIGVVVGGSQTYMQCIDRKLDVGINAALVNERVLVLTYGVYWVVSDAAVAVGAILTPGTTTAGRALTGAYTTDAVAGQSGNIIGMARELAGAAGVTILADIFRN